MINKLHIKGSMRVIKQGELFHLYLVDGKDVWLNTAEAKRLYNLLGNNLGVKNAVVKYGQTYLFIDDEEFVDMCEKCSLGEICPGNGLCIETFDVDVTGKRFKPL